jgi:hypothetical protein
MEPEEVAEKWLRRLFSKNTGLCKDIKSMYRV